MKIKLKPGDKVNVRGRLGVIKHVYGKEIIVFFPDRETTGVYDPLSLEIVT